MQVTADTCNQVTGKNYRFKRYFCFFLLKFSSMQKIKKKSEVQLKIENTNMVKK
jgi:hypothetical protein